nr:MAG TPA: Thymidylate synthase [Caudoviricetes sp.]DAS44777.1 MAG TPA: Thymidylate synthase [Caudoviricetes sp.]DAT40486.1 MAG TPA: Thymidylate synthase [Caudoviricetes sp.]
MIIDRLLHDTMSRRIILSLWNPVDLKEMSLEPC